MSETDEEYLRSKGWKVRDQHVYGWPFVNPSPGYNDRYCTLKEALDIQRERDGESEAEKE